MLWQGHKVNSTTEYLRPSCSRISWSRHRRRWALGHIDAPARAFRCASAIRAAATAHGLQVRAGIHAGEVATVGSDIRGVAVHEAARVMAVAAPDEILVSETIPSLVSGLGLVFDDRGEHELKGFGSRRLFSFSG